MSQSKLNLENKILADIKSGRLKLRSKYIFWAEKFGVGGAFVLSLILAIIFFNLALFYMRATDNLEYLSFGVNGLLAFLESFPYLLVVSLIIFVLLTGYLITKSGLTYKQPFKYIALILLLFIILSGSALAYTNIAEKIEQQVYSSKAVAPFLKPFFNRSQYLNNRGVAGMIQEIEENNLVIQTPQGLLNVNLAESDYEQPFAVSQFIMAIGEKQGNNFITHKIRVIDQDALPMLKRGIHHRFNMVNDNYQNSINLPINPPKMLPNKKCLDDCALIIPPHKNCMQDCMQEQE